MKQGSIDLWQRHRPYDPNTHEYNLGTHAIRRVIQKDGGQDYPLTFHVVSDEKAMGSDATRTLSDTIEGIIRPHGPRLIELFWRHVQPCYPLLPKEHFMKNYGVSPERVTPPLRGAVYLSALRWWSYDCSLSIIPSPDPVILRKVLLEAIRNSYHRPRLSSIAAILLLLQCQPEDPLNPDHTYDWGLTCQALAIGQCIGLHLDASAWEIPQWERNMRKRLSWALYMQDRWTALAYGRPVHIHEDDWAVQDLADEDFTDCDAVGQQDHEEERRSLTMTGTVQFMLMVRLSRILASVLSSFYGARTSIEQDTVLLYQQAQRLFLDLQRWYQEIPPWLQMDITYQRKLSFHGRCISTLGAFSQR